MIYKKKKSLVVIEINNIKFYSILYTMWIGLLSERVYSITSLGVCQISISYNGISGFRCDIDSKNGLNKYVNQ